MEPNPPLDVLLPKLRAKLLENGLTPEHAATTCKAIQNGKKPRELKTAEEYQVAWTICDSMEDVLTTLDDVSEAAEWCTAIAHRIFSYEDAFKARHGYMPLHPGRQHGEWDGPAGTA